MLNYHIIHPQPFKASNAEYNHFLSLGSHSSAISLGSLLSFSTVSLHKGTKLYIDQNFVEEGTFNAVVNLGKCVRVNGQVCGNGGVVMHVKVVEDVVEPQIEGKQPSKQQSKVLYLLIRDTPSPTPSQSLTCQATPLTPNMSIRLQQIAESQELGMPKKTLVLIESGCLQMPSTSQQVEESTCIFSREGCPNLIAVRPTTVVVISGF